MYKLKWDSYLFALKDCLVAIPILYAFFNRFRVRVSLSFCSNARVWCVVKFIHQLHKFTYGCGLRSQYSNSVKWRVHEHPTETVQEGETPRKTDKQTHSTDFRMFQLLCFNECKIYILALQQCLFTYGFKYHSYWILMQKEIVYLQTNRQ